MFLLRYSTTVLLLVFIASGAASGVDVMKAVGDTVSFRPDNFVPPVTSITWKQKNSAGVVVKAIEWDDEDGITIPHPRFKDITALDVKTGQITITGLKVEHSGEYILEINSKEQEQRFTLTIKERVPKPEIKIEKTDDPDVVYLRCEYSEPIIWKNSAGETLTGSKIAPTGESITVKKNDPGIFYTCTLDNGASKETSAQVYERDLFKDGSSSGTGSGKTAVIIIGVILLIIIIIIIICIVLYKRNRKFKERADKVLPCIKVSTEGQENNSTVPPKSNESVPLNTEENNRAGQDAEDKKQ